jgi:mannose-6-phosphate isomerase-like protein (cupin superfamily)
VQSETLVAIEDIRSLPEQPVHAACTKSIVHRVDAAETSLFRVSPGGRVAAHTHSHVWDLFTGLEGVGEIEFEGPDGNGRVDLTPNSFCAMPAGLKHEVRNRSDSEMLVFMLVHAPFDSYDHVPAQFEGDSDQ